MKKTTIFVVFLLLAAILVAGCGSSAPDTAPTPGHETSEPGTSSGTATEKDMTAIDGELPDDIPRLTSGDTTELANHLSEGRWVGYLKVNVTEGYPAHSKTVSNYEMDLNLVFTEHPDYPGMPPDLAFSGIAQVRYEVPIWQCLGKSGFNSITFDLHPPFITSPISGRVSNLGVISRNKPAHMLFTNRDLLYATGTSTIVYDTDPPYVDVITERGGFIYGASDNFGLRHLQFIAFMPVEDDRIELSTGLFFENDSLLRIDPIMEGYLQRVQEKTLTSSPQPGDRLETEKDEAVKFRFSNGGGGEEIEILLEPNSRLEIAEADSVDYEALLDLMIGEVHARLPEIPRRFEIRTPVAVAGVRGTEFSVKVLEDGATNVTVYDGMVDLTCRETGETVSLTGNQYATVYPGKGVAEPVEAEEQFNLPFSNWR